MAEHPFKDIQIASSEFLDTTQGRSECPKCRRSRKYYCYTCYVPVDHLEGKIPSVKLPLKIDIIKHQNEVDGKSTSAHCKVLAPEDVEIYNYPCIPDYPRDGSVVLVFPGENACTLEELVSQTPNKQNTLNNCSPQLNDIPVLVPITTESPCKDRTIDPLLTLSSAENGLSILGTCESTKNVPVKQDEISDSDVECNVHADKAPDNSNVHAVKAPNNSNDHADKSLNNSDETDAGSRGVKRKFINMKEGVQSFVKKAILIDSTWNQTSRISSDERLKGIPFVILTGRESQFWRHQRENPATYLSTIEALYYLVRDYHSLFISTNYSGEYDNLLFFFSFMYQKIHGLYSDRCLKADTQRKKMKH